MDILVIGDVDHPRATCVHWMGIWPNVEEFDLVIVTQNTLTQEIFDQIPDKLKEINSQIFTVFTTGRSVWCIIEKLMLPSPPKTGPKAFHGIPPTNYDWLFVYPTIHEVVEGTSVQIVDQKFVPYLEKVKKWSLEIENVYMFEVEAGLERPVEASGILLEPIVENKSGKMIGARAISVSPDVYGEGGSVCFLPKPSECNTHEAVEILIDIATGKERVEPEWRAKLQIPGIDEVEKQINQLELDYKKQIGTLNVKWKSLDKYRDLFSVHEAPQIEAVKLILKDIGFETARTKPGFPIDLLGKGLAVEVTSIAGKVNSDSPKMFQLMQFFEKHRKSEKVVLIANTFKREMPSKRSGREDFTPQVVAYMKSNEVCAMTCVTLFELWKLAKKDQPKMQKLILETNGELTF